MDAPSDRDLTLAPSSSRRFTGESHATRSTGIPGTPEHGPAAHDATARPDGSPAVSIDELPLPPLDPGMLDDHVDHVDVLDDFDVAGGSGMLDDVFTLDPDQLFVPPGAQQPAGSGAGSLQHSEPGGSLGRSEHEKGFENEDPEKRTARLARNRESAQLSRQRKKQQLSDLERRCRSLHAANSQMHQLVARLSHENHALRHHIASTGGVPLPPHLRTPATPPPVVVLPPGATPPPGMVPLHPSMMPQATKVPLPTNGATLNKPTHTPEKPGTLRDDVPGSIPPAATPAVVATGGGKRRKATGGGVAAVTAGALAVLSVVCLAGVGSTGSTGSTGSATGSSSLALGSAARMARHQRRLMSVGSVAAEENAAGSAEPIPMRGTSREIALRPEPPGVDLWDARGKASYREVLGGGDGEDSVDASGATALRRVAPTGSSGEASFGEADPLFAAFRAAGLRADALSRVVCQEMFRWTPAGNSTTGGSGVDVELARRVRVAMEEDEEESGEDGGEDEEDEAWGGVKRGGVADGTIEKTRSTPAGELLPAAIPLPPSVAPDGTGVALNVMGDTSRRMTARAAEAAAARSISTGRFDGEDDANLVSVLFGEPQSPSKTDEDSRLFVVTHSPRSSEYVTYACRFPRGTYIGSAAARS